jgi:hypothetical protein
VSRWQRFLAKYSPVSLYRPLKRPTFPVNSELEARAHAIRLREKLGDPKPLRSVAPQSVAQWSFDANGAPVDG